MYSFGTSLHISVNDEVSKSLMEQLGTHYLNECLQVEVIECSFLFVLKLKSSICSQNIIFPEVTQIAP